MGVAVHRRPVLKPTPRTPFAIIYTAPGVRAQLTMYAITHDVYVERSLAQHVRHHMYYCVWCRRRRQRWYRRRRHRHPRRRRYVRVCMTCITTTRSHARVHAYKVRAAARSE